MTPDDWDRNDGLADEDDREPLPTYTNPDVLQFIADMRDAGLPVEHYHGRYYWEGPAVRVDNLQDALSETHVPAQWDNMGLGWIVYPRARDAGVPASVARDLEAGLIDAKAAQDKGL